MPCSMKMRNVKSSAKELLFPVYTFMLVALLRSVVDLGGSGEPQQWQAVRVPSLANTRAGWLCRHAGAREDPDGARDESAWTRSPRHYAHGTLGMRGLQASVGQAGNTSMGCIVVLSPSTSPWVQSMSATLQHMFGSGTSAIRTVLVANQTQAKRLHLDHPGHVLAAIDFGGAKSILQDSSACLFGAARVGGGGSGDGGGGPCVVKMDVRLNATMLLEVKSGMSPWSEVNVGLLSVQDTMHEALRRNVWGKTPADSAGKVQVSVYPMPVSSLGDLGAAETKISIITSLYFVAAWIPSMQILLVNIVTEKKSGFRSILRCMGLKDHVFWLAWLLSELATFTTAILLVVTMGSYTGLFADSDTSLVVVIFLLFVSSICTFSFLVSVFFQEPKVAGAVGSGLLAAFSFLFTVLRITRASPQLFWVMSLLSPIAMSSAGADMWSGGVRWGALNAGYHPVGKVVSVCMCACVCMCIHTYICMYVCMHACIHRYINTHTHTHTHTHT